MTESSSVDVERDAWKLLCDGGDAWARKFGYGSEHERQVNDRVLELVAKLRAEHVVVLPTWDEMSDLDKGAALLHLWKCENEGTDYATNEYPCKYIEDPRLLALGKEASSRHAQSLDPEGDLEEALGDEWERLYNLALDHERKG